MRPSYNDDLAVDLGDALDHERSEIGRFHGDFRKLRYP